MILYPEYLRIHNYSASFSPKYNRNHLFLALLKGIIKQRTEKCLSLKTEFYLFNIIIWILLLFLLSYCKHIFFISNLFIMVFTSPSLLSFIATVSLTLYFYFSLKIRIYSLVKNVFITIFGT